MNRRPLLLWLAVPLLVGWRWPGDLNELAAKAAEALRQRAPRQAVQHYAEALRDAPNSAELRYNLGTAYLAQGEYARAAETLERAAEVARDGKLLNRVHYNRGNALYRLNQLEEAAKQYEEALRYDPEDEDAKYNLELLRRKQNPPPEKQQGGERQGQQGGGEQQPNQGGGQNGPSQTNGGQPPQPPPGQPSGRSDQQRPLNEPLPSETQVDRMLRELAQDEQRLQGYFNGRPNAKPGQRGFGGFDQLQGALDELTGGGDKRDW